MTQNGRYQYKVLVGGILLCSAALLCNYSLAVAQEPVSSGTTTTSHDEPPSTTERTDTQQKGLFPGFVKPNPNLNPNLPIIAPTPNLSAIQNVIKVTTKGVSVNLRIPANIPILVPFEVSIAYISPVQTNTKTETYNRTTGLTLLYHEAEGDGKPRPMHLDITVRELVPNGQSVSFNKDFTVTPLYKVSLSQLRFDLLDECDKFIPGKSDIRLVWLRPDGKRKQIKFDIGARDGDKPIKQFRSRHSRISVESGLVEPTVQFFEDDFHDNIVPGFTPIRSSGTPLVPGAKQQLFNFVLKEKLTGPFDQTVGVVVGCQARIRYRIDRTVMTFDGF